MKDFAWWDTMYTKAAKNIQIKTGDEAARQILSPKGPKLTPPSRVLQL